MRMHWVSATHFGRVCGLRVTQRPGRSTRAENAEGYFL